MMWTLESRVIAQYLCSPLSHIFSLITINLVPSSTLLVEVFITKAEFTLWGNTLSTVSRMTNVLGPEHFSANQCKYMQC